MKYDFDEIIPRRHTNSLKYDWAEKRGKPDDLLPMWVAQKVQTGAERRPPLKMPVEYCEDAWAGPPGGAAYV